MAISTLLRALHRLCADFLLTLRRTLRDAQQPAPALPPEAQQKLLGLIAADAGRAVREATYRAQVSVVRAVNLASVAVIVAMIMAGVSAGFWWGWSSAAGRDIDTKSILGTMPAAKAAAWAQIISLNPPPSAWAQKPYRSGDGSMAVEIALRLTPIPTTPAAPASR